MKNKTKQTNIRISAAGLANLAAIAAATGMNKTAIIEMAIAKLAKEMSK